MSTWQEEQAAREAQLVATLDAIAAHLDGWTVEKKHDRSARLIGPDGVTIWARVETYGAKRGRLELSAGVPDAADYSAGDYSGLDRPEITVSMDRDPATLARDISRRLIRGTVDYWATVAGRIEARTTAANAREKLARELADIMGGTARDVRDRGDWQAELPDSMRRGKLYTYGHMAPDYRAEDVTVELRNISPDQARELARLIASWNA